MKPFKVLAFACFLFSARALSKGTWINIECVQINACQCNTTEGMIDLSPLDSQDPKKPSFRYVPVGGNISSDLFSWNPCTPFTDRDCKNVSTCQIESFYHPSQEFNIGEHRTADFLTNYTMAHGLLNTTSLTIKYLHKQQGNTRTSYVMLVCDPGDHGSFVPYGETGYHTMTYYFLLKSKYACPGYGDGFSVTLIIIAVVAGISGLVLLYCLVGTTVNICCKKRSGYDVFPFLNICQRCWTRPPRGSVRLVEAT